MALKALKVALTTKRDPEFGYVYEKMKQQRENSHELSRCGTFKDGVILKDYSSACFAHYRRSSHSVPSGAGFFSVFNGDFEEARKVENKGMAGVSGHRLNYNLYELNVGSDRSLRFVKWLLDENKSPWAYMLPMLVETDPEVINHSGFIIENITKKDFDPIFNFLVAARFSYEYPFAFNLWLKLQDLFGFTENEAFLVANNFKDKDTDCRNGDADNLVRLMPDHHQAIGSFHESARRIINCNPGKKGPMNIWDMWVTKEDKKDQNDPQSFSGRASYYEIKNYLKTFKD